MQWQYSDYPVIQDGRAVLTSGTVEIEMTAPPKLSVTKFQHWHEHSVSPRPTDPAKWRISSDIPEDLRRFIRGKYWHSIDTHLLIGFLKERGMAEAAGVYERIMAS